jgi:ectoine hydroxylase-related dioxygenase (phytanoyl-CoA dioxygenase family)
MPLELKTQTGHALKPSFDEDGYVCVSPLFDAAKMVEINTELARFIKVVMPNMPDSHVYLEDKKDPSSIKQLLQMFEYDAYFRELMLKSPVRKIAEDVLQDEVVPMNMQFFNKPAGTGQATPPHQDGYYFHLTPCRAVTGWLALEDVDEENGCIHYIRGSHKAEAFRKHGITSVLGFSQGMTDFGTADDTANTIAFPGSAGTFLMHDAKTVHWAGANKSKTRSRRALGFIYYAKSAKLDLEQKQAYQTLLDTQLRSTGKI